MERRWFIIILNKSEGYYSYISCVGWLHITIIIHACCTIRTAWKKDLEAVNDVMQYVFVTLTLCQFHYYLWFKGHVVTSIFSQLPIWMNFFVLWNLYLWVLSYFSPVPVHIAFNHNEFTNYAIMLLRFKTRWTYWSILHSLSV